MLIAFLAVLFSVAAQEEEDNHIDTSNWTTCEQFLNNSVFDPMSVVDIDWKIFYSWSFQSESSYNVRFRLATPSLISRFRMELDDEIRPPMNWSDAQLFMETNIDISALFVKTNVSGSYLLIPSLAIQYVNIRPRPFAMKIVEPGYLGIENCGLKICYALAPVDKMPNSTALDEEAKKLGFNGFVSSPVDQKPPPYFDADMNYEEKALDDDEEDEYFQIERMSEFL